MNGLLFLRWLLHSILPYPTFLWDEYWTAACLRISVDSLRSILTKESKLKEHLQLFLYQGILSGFLGNRWWKSGINQFAWELRQNGAKTPSEFHSALETLADCKLTQLKLESPSVCLGTDLLPSGEIINVTDVVRIIPDMWPPFADSALVKRSTASTISTIKAIVHPLDRMILEEMGD